MARAKRKRQSKVYSDFGTAERAQHGPIEFEDVPEDMEDTKNRTRARAVEVDDPLFTLKRNGTISRLQRDAALILRELWYAAGLEPRVISQYQEMISSGSVVDIRSTTIDRHRKFILAIRAAGVACSDAIISVCCLQNPVNSNQVNGLKVGLDNLVEYFGVR